MRQPTISFQKIRDLAERWSWEVPTASGGRVRVTGFNVPDSARKSARRVPFFIKVVTKKGELMQGEVVSLRPLPEHHQRLIQWCASGEIRRICDCLVIEIDGIRVVTH